MPTNLYGPGDDFDLESAHVIPALMRKLHEGRESGGKEVVVWGSGTPRREFLHVDDLAHAAVFMMEVYAGEEHVNVGTGRDITIRGLAQMLKEVIGFPGRLTYDAGRPDGTPRKLLDVTRLTRLGWRARIELRAGLTDTYRWFLAGGSGLSRRADSSSRATPPDPAQVSTLDRPRNVPPAPPGRLL